MRKSGFVLAFIATLTLSISLPLLADDGERLLSVDHYVRVHSTAPAATGQTAQLYVREVVKAGSALRSVAADRVVLFVHGAGTPAEVAFDAPYKDYSWMQYLAAAGFDVFSMDMTGYGRSTRPAAMNEPCNLSSDQLLTFGPGLAPSTPCAAGHAQNITTMGSDWDDISAVVDHVLALRHVDQLSMIAWSQGGPRSVGYAAAHPGKVRRLVLLAPAYTRAGASDPPAQNLAAGAAMNTQSRAEFIANWDRQVGCPEQYEPAASDAIWKAMLESDPVGATWGTGVRRAPNVPTWGFNAAVAGRLKIPVLAVTGAYDKQVPSERVHDFYADLGSSQKVVIDLACSSHNAMWEKNHLLLFRASLEWLTKGTANGVEQGVVRLGF